MAALVKRGGLLVTLAYPLADADKGWGPPWFLRAEHYDEVLQAAEWEQEINKPTRATWIKTQGMLQVYSLRYFAHTYPSHLRTSRK